MSDYYFSTKDLSVGYNGKALINDINVELSKGQIMTLIGPNGSGKSTILKSISNHLKTIGGTVYIGGETLAKMSFKGIYKNVPFWSGSHHEFLNGRGYPNQLEAKDLPNESRLLTIIDVYDALTAEDRPYKPPMPPEKAFAILGNMRDDGQIDGHLLEQFIESEAWKKD